jgi:hypothetical protein
MAYMNAPFKIGTKSKNMRKNQQTSTKLRDMEKAFLPFELALF